MAIELPELPYATTALEPHVSARTLEFHHGKHHRGYVAKLNAAIEGTGLAGQPLEKIIAAAHEQQDAGVFNNAAQVWNHTFLWHSMTPDGGGKPSGALAAAIERDCGGIDGFRDQFKQAAAGQFGSGWAWLVVDGGKLRIVTTGNADTPLIHGWSPLLTLDVWEHAYYLDYQNDRGGYIDSFLDALINWDFAAERYAEATAA